MLYRALRQSITRQLGRKAECVAAGTIEQAHDVPIIVYHGWKNTPLGPEETFRAMGKARLDTCLSSSSSPKLISDDSIYKALKRHVWY